MPPFFCFRSKKQSLLTHHIPPINKKEIAIRLLAMPRQSISYDVLIGSPGDGP